jgi:hypothetical protein
MSKIYTKVEQKKLLLYTLQENSDKLLPLVKDTITKILKFKGKKWVEVVDPKVKDETYKVFELTKKIKPNSEKFIDGLINNLDLEYFVYDENNQWTYINKLNTNKSDFPIFIADLLENSKHFDMCKIKMGIKKSDYSLFKEFLLEIEKHPEFIWNKFLYDPDRYTQNIKKNSLEGEMVETHVMNYYIKNGWEIVHRGGDGDIIDMLLGVDLIVKNGEEYQYIQVKKLPSIEVINIDDQKYTEIKGDIHIRNLSVIDVVAYATLDGDVIVSNRQNYYYYKNGELKTEFGFPVPSKVNKNKILIKN